MLLLPLIVLIPFAALLPLLLLDKHRSYAVSTATSIIVFVLVLASLYISCTSGLGSLSFSVPYLGQLGIGIQFQATQLTMLLALMSSIVFLAASIVGRYYIGGRERIYNMILLISEGSALGVFLSGNLFLLYVFWEVAEVMMFFMIFIYGAYNRRYASLKFLSFSIVSSLLLLIGIMVLYSSQHTFAIASIISAASSIPMHDQVLVTVLFLIAFMIKTPVFPFHGWLPDAHTEAPTTGSMILAGVLLKFGGYGLFLMFSMIPFAASHSYYIALIFIFSALYGAAVCVRQTNMKRMIAYTSITDMGIVAMALAAVSPIATSGAAYAMLSHGLAISLLFLVAGTVDEMYGTLEIAKLKGIARNFPVLAYLFIFGTLAVIGLPLTAGFVGELLVFIGSFSHFGFLSLIPIAGILLIGAALLWTVERSFMNLAKTTEAFSRYEGSVMVAASILIVSTVLLGVFPILLQLR